MLYEVITDLPPDGGRQLLELYKQVPGNRKYGQAYSALDDLRYFVITSYSIHYTKLYEMDETLAEMAVANTFVLSEISFLAFFQSIAFNQSPILSAAIRKMFGLW